MSWTKTLGRSVLHVAIAVGVGLLISTVFSGNAFVSWVLVGLTALYLIRAVVKALQRPKPMRALVVVGLTVLFGLGLFGAASQALDDDSLVGAINPASFIADERGECKRCASFEDFDAYAVAQRGSHTDLNLRLHGAVRNGLELWIWHQRSPADPIVLKRELGSWRAQVPRATALSPRDLTVAAQGRTVVLTIRDRGSLGGMAVVTSGGDRVPELGIAHAEGLTYASGDVGKKVDRAVAIVQREYPNLDDARKELARALIARQLVTSSYIYAMQGRDFPKRARAIVTIDYPRLAQRLVFPGVGELKLVFDTDRVTSCLLSGRNSRCSRIDTTEFPAGLAAQTAAHPDEIEVVGTRARRVLGEPARCVKVTKTVAGGPSIGEFCSLPDGTLAFSHDHKSGRVLTLIERTTEVRESDFRLPQGANDA